MEEYIGRDVSVKGTAVSIRRGGLRVWRGKCVTDPSVIATLIRKRAPAVKRVVFETGRIRPVEAACLMSTLRVKARA